MKENKNLGTSGKTIIDAYINHCYPSLFRQSLKITSKNYIMAEDLLHYCLYTFYQSYTLDKYSNNSEKQFHTYFMQFLNNTYKDKRNDFNKEFRNLIYSNDFVEDIDDNEQTKKIKMLEYFQEMCIEEGLKNINIQPLHKRYYFEQIFEFHIRKGMGLNKYAEAIGVPKSKIYTDWYELKELLIAYAKKNCENYFAKKLEIGK